MGPPRIGRDDFFRGEKIRPFTVKFGPQAPASFGTRKVDLISYTQGRARWGNETVKVSVLGEDGR